VLFRSRAGVVLGARRCRAIHQQAGPLPGAGTTRHQPNRGATDVSATERATELVTAAATAAGDKLAQQMIAFDVSEQLYITEAFLLCSGSNDRQVQSIVDAIEERLRQLNAKPVRREGEREGGWVLLDYGDIVVHV